jgi:hypothetical protein
LHGPPTHFGDRGIEKGRSWQYNATRALAYGRRTEEAESVPTIDHIGPYKLFFYSAEGSEAPHVHVRRNRATAKFWLNPVRLARSRRFNDHDLLALQRIVEENEGRILEAWHEHFGN